MIVDSSICDPHIGCMVTSRHILISSTNRWLGSVYHMVLMWLIHVRIAMFLSSLIILMCLAYSAIAITCVLLPLHHVFRVSNGASRATWEALRRVLVLSLWVVLVMMVWTAAATSGHWLIYPIISCFRWGHMTSLHMLWCRPGPIRSSGYYTSIHIMSTMHLLLAPWSAVMSWTWVSHGRGSGFSVTPGRLSVTWSMDRLVLMMSVWLLLRKFTCFGVTVIIKPHRIVVLMLVARLIALIFAILSIGLIILIFRDQIVVTWRIASTI